jgi:hypothetical protein
LERGKLTRAVADAEEGAAYSLEEPPWRDLPGGRELMDEVFGSAPLPAFNPAWRTPEVLTLATGAYEEHHPLSGRLLRDRLLVLADALLDAGCNSQAIQRHLRSRGKHVLGCWCVDLVLDRR